MKVWVGVLVLGGCAAMEMPVAPAGAGEPAETVGDVVLGVSGVVAEWAGIPGLAVALGALGAARRARRGPSRAQGAVEVLEGRVEVLETYHPEIGEGRKA